MAKILVVDDNPVDQKLVHGLLLELTDIAITCASNGKEALALIAQDAPDLVLTDLQMPEMDGLQLVKKVRANHSHVPVILMTAYGSEEIALTALHRGAANYVPKKNLAKDLLEAVESVLAAAVDHRVQQRLFGQLRNSEMHFELENDIALIPPLVNCCKENLARIRLLDNTELIRVTVALREALMNAIIHGNLEVGSALRDTDLDAYYRLIEERRTQSPYVHRRVHVHVKESGHQVEYVIRDEGPGFDPAEIPDPTDPENMEKASGRGLLLIRTFMSEFAHNGHGNEIRMIKRRTE
jgi:CheY-like chemotaxis protein/anti-sigma regulatory factor (Ser/Thr protein kinase)